MYVSKNQVPVADAEVSGLQKTLYNKYYIDELYDAIVVRPLYWLSGILDTVIEKLGIDKQQRHGGAKKAQGLRYLCVLAPLR